MTPNILNKKKSVALKYQEFLYRLLDVAVTILGIKGHSEERKFAEMFSAVAYFRIPMFR